MRRAASWLAMALATTVAPAADAAPVGAADAASALAAGPSDEDAASPESARLLVERWSGAGYAEREAITQTLVEMDDRAVAALVVAKRGPSATVRAWAAETLEGMGRERADEQIRTRSDAILGGILRAFGEARDPDALGVLSSFVSSDRAPLREAARAALLDFGEEARSKVRQDYAELTGVVAPPAWSASRVAHALFDASDAIRLREVYGLLHDGLERADAGDTAGAAADFDAVLARQPDLRRSEIAEAYLAHALSLEDADPGGARSYFEKAQKLAPGTPEAARSESQLAFLEGSALEARGVPAEDSYVRALRLDATNQRARSALARVQGSAAARHAELLRGVTGAVVGLGAVIAAILFVGRRRSRRAPRKGT
jgi:hypothetical protein